MKYPNLNYFFIYKKTIYDTLKNMIQAFINY